MKIKMFTSNVSLDDLENKVHDWNKDLKIKIIDIKLDCTSLNDRYDDGTICNQWIEYSVVIIYQLN